MLRSRFLWKLYAGYSMLIIIFAIIVWCLIGQRIEKDSMGEIRASLKARAFLLKELALSSLTETPDPSLQYRIKMLGLQIDTRLTIIDADGIVLADSNQSPSEMDNHLTRPEILAARSHGSGTAERFSDTLGKKMLYLALPVYAVNRLAGYVRASLPLTKIDLRINNLRAAIGAGVVIAMLVALLLGFLLARRFIHPLTSMTVAAKAMAGGDYRQRLPIVRKDEIGILAKTLNHMAESLQNRIETISAQRNKLLTILEGMVEGVIATDSDERVIHMNEAAGNMLGINPDESLGRPVWEVSFFKGISEALSNAIREGTGERGTICLAQQPKDRILEICSSPLFDTRGRTIGAMLVLHDISELHHLETVRRDFVSNASHELKTPITAIRGMAETLIDDPAMPSEKHRRYLDKIMAQSLRLSSIVADLLTLSRLESGSAESDAALCDLRDVVSDAAGGLLPIAGGKGLVVDIDVGDIPMYVLGDEPELVQVVDNLLDNALKYTPEGGRISVRLSRIGNNAVMEIEDTGIGIEPNEHNRIFERFYRVDKARSRELGGTGLGLSIVKHIVIAHLGTVSVESAPGTGSTFRVCLPLASDSN